MTADPASLARAIDAIGGRSFAAQLLVYLNAAVHAEHCVLYRFSADAAGVLGVASSDGTQMAQRNSERYRHQFWGRDAVFQGLRNGLRGYASGVACVATADVTDPEFRHELFLAPRLAGRAMLVGERNGMLYGLSLFRAQSSGFFHADERANIGALADMLVSCVAQHDRLLQCDDTLQATLASVPALVGAFAGLGLTRRESEVCARIAYGASMKEIARELGISADSGVTYRRRAYLRLGCGNRSELLRCMLQHRHAAG